MRVLVTETHPEAAVPAARQLVAAGHDVVRCRDDDAPAFPCAGLATGACPLDQGVDVVLTVRTGPPGQPTLREDGAVCALRRHVPLVVAGTLAPNPFARWATVSTEDRDVVTACEQAMAADIAHLSDLARREARQAVRRRGHVAGAVDARTTRSARAIKVDLTLPASVSDREADAVAVAVGDAVRAADPTSTVIDVRRSES